MTWKRACLMSLNYYAKRHDSEGLLWMVYLRGQGHRYIDRLVATTLFAKERDAAPDDWSPDVALDPITALARLSPAYRDRRPGAPSLA